MFSYALGGVDLNLMLGSSNPQVCGQTCCILATLHHAATLNSTNAQTPAALCVHRRPPPTHTMVMPTQAAIVLSLLYQFAMGTVLMSLLTGASREGLSSSRCCAPLWGMGCRVATLARTPWLC
jgi:hypothetical protein